MALNHRRTLATLGLAAGLTLGLAACSDGATDSQSSGSATSQGSGTSTTASAADIAFAQLMIPHHEQAVEMAEMALAPSSQASAQVTELAEQIKGAQGPEIAQMTSWLQEWGQPTVMPSMGDMAGHDMGGMTMSGMMTSEQMDVLGGSSGGAFDQMWLEMMIAHHQGALEMAEQVLATTSNPGVSTMAQDIVAGQQAEIATMQGMLQ